MERRIGARRTITWLQLSWRVVRRGRWRSHLVEERVSALDVSTSGMGVRSATVPNLRRGDVVELVLGEHELSARVRRVVETADPGTTDYGLEFIDPTPAFLETILTQSGAGSTADLELFWRRAA